MTENRATHRERYVNVPNGATSSRGHAARRSATIYRLVLLLGALISGGRIDQLLGQWGYGLVFAVVALQALGAPLPGTTAVLSAGLYAGATHRLGVAGIMIAAIAGVLAGGSAGFALGRWGGWALLERYGRYLRLTPERLMTSRYIFQVHGGKVVFVGRFITGLRNVTGFLAGANRMSFRRFVAFSALSATIWATVNGAGYFYFGHALRRASVAVDVALGIFVLVWIVGGIAFVRRRENTMRLAAQRAQHAHQAQLEPLDQH